MGNLAPIFMPLGKTFQQMLARTNDFILVHFGRLNPVMRAMIWMGLSGIVFALLNAILRHIALQMNPLQVQFLRYFAGLIVMIPFIARVGARAYSPRGVVVLLWSLAFHTSGMVLWYIALPHLTLADMTAIGFTGPIFIMAGAVLALGEKMVWERWVSAISGFRGCIDRCWPGDDRHGRILRPRDVGVFAVVRCLRPDHQGHDPAR